VRAARGTSALALLIPLVASRLLHNSRTQPAITDRMMTLLRDAAREVLRDEASARSFDFHAASQLPWPNRKELARLGESDLTSDEIGLIRGVPVVIREENSRHDQAFSCELIQNRRADYLWAKVHAPLRGPAFFAAFGLFALIQETANQADYRSITLPAMAGVAALSGFYFDVLDRRGWEDRSTAMMLDVVVRDVTSADDPQTELSQVLDKEIAPSPVESPRHPAEEPANDLNAAGKNVGVDTNPDREDPSMSRESRLSEYLKKTRGQGPAEGVQEVAARVEMILSALELPWHVEDRAQAIWGVEADVGLVFLGLDETGDVLSLWQKIHPIRGDSAENADYFNSLLHINASTTGACFAINDYGDEDEEWLLIIGRIAAAKLDLEEVELALESVFYLSKLFDDDNDK